MADEVSGEDAARAAPTTYNIPEPKQASTISLAQSLERTGRHPVLIFGSSKSGKSMLILSLIRALQRSRDIDVELGEPVFDRADPRSKDRHSFAKRFYDHENFRLQRGERIDATQSDAFFVPVDIKPRNSLLPPVKLAFLDSRGEDYEPSQDNHADFYKQLSPEIRDVLQNFSYGVTVIYVAPYSVGSTHDRDTLNSNFGLLGALRGYRELRRLRRNDFHLFLLSKWDQYAAPMDGRPLFDQVDPVDVDTVLGDRYPQAWGDFQSLPLEGEAKDRRAFTQYSSGYFVDGFPATPPASFDASYLRYPRTVLNWLYGNATQFKVTDEERAFTLRKILFDDVVPPTEPRVTLTDRMAALLTTR